MYYELDAGKARRVFMVKFTMAWLAAIVVTAVPIWIAFKAGAI